MVRAQHGGAAAQRRQTCAARAARASRASLGRRDGAAAASDTSLGDGPEPYSRRGPKGLPRARARTPTYFYEP